MASRGAARPAPRGDAPGAPPARAHRLPRTVVYVDHATGLGGAERSLLELLCAIDRARVKPVLACVEGALAREARQRGEDVRLVPLERLKGATVAPLRMWRGIAALASLLREERADLVHANTLRAAAYVSLASRRSGTPHVWHVRDIHVRSAAAWWLCRSSAAVIANSSVAACALPCADRARVVYNPIALREPRPMGRAALGLPDGQLVASVGILRPWKGHDTFLDVAARVREPGVQFLVIGGRIHGDEETDLPERLTEQARRLGLESRAHFLGHREDLPDIWPHLQMLVHAARSEPFGRVAAEALVAGVPVVAFRDGGLPEIVDDGQTGILVPPRDIEAMAAAVDALLSRAELRARMGAEGRARASMRFSPDGHARAIEALYDDLLSREPATD